MEQLTEVMINAGISIITILIGLAVDALRKYLAEKKVELQAKTTKEEWDLLQSIGMTAVSAVEQISRDLAIQGEDKFEQARQMVIRQANNYGLAISEREIQLVIESAVNELNLVRRDVYDALTE